MYCKNAFPGFNLETLKRNMHPYYLEKDEAKPGVMGMKYEVTQDVSVTFWLLLAIYFPAVTGIMTGTNMSGDLKDPQKSIPAGTIAATITTSLIYFALAILFGASIEGAVLRDKSGKSIASSLVVASLSWPTPWVVIVGSFLSTFGAALQCLCSAPRLLQSIAKDDVIPMLAPFARVTKSNEPFLGLLFTAFIAELAILLGAVDDIAAVLDFFFLMCYAFVNLICALHSLLGAPNWRPRFKYYHWSLSVAGAFLCFFIMFASEWHYALIACGLTMAIYKYVEWKGAKKEWGDGIRGLALTTAQYSLLKVEDKDPHPKNWRPQLLILVDGKYSKEMIDLRSVNLLNLAGQMKAGRGLAITVGFVKSDNLHGLKKRADDIKHRIQQDMLQARLRGFGKCLFFEQHQIYGAVSALYQSVGIGGLRPNTVILNFPRQGENENSVEQLIFAEQLIRGVQYENCMIVCKGITDFPKATARLSGTMDIWWIVHDGGILMLIAFLLQQHKVMKMKMI
uniref:Amino acid permease/ SLC12A domain-containing protein n=1 Tax=Panagrolaimus superbus TaxID=310955 RepID=A0A914Z869_9BILA